MSKNSNYLFRLDLLILSILKDRNAYGYEITKLVTELTNGTIVPKQGTMYPIIYRLLEEGLITSHTELVNNKARVYYHIESKGEEYLKKITEEYDEVVRCIDLIVHGVKHYER